MVVHKKQWNPRIVGQEDVAGRFYSKWGRRVLTGAQTPSKSAQATPTTSSTIKRKRNLAKTVEILLDSSLLTSDLLEPHGQHALIYKDLYQTVTKGRSSHIRGL